MPRIKRPHSIVVKVTAEERDAFYRASSKLKLSGSDWLRGLGMVEVMDKPVELEGPSDMGNPITEPVPPIQPFVEATPLAMKFTEQTPTALKHNAQPAEARMYDVIEKRNGRAAADAWMNARKAPKTSPAPVVIGEPQVPGHLRAFYDNLVKNQGQAQADFWLLTNSKGVKLAP